MDKTPGQIAYEQHMLQYGEQYRPQWDLHLTDEGRAHWERVALAVLKAKQDGK